jgi:hypothetical protein
MHVVFNIPVRFKGNLKGKISVDIISKSHPVRHWRTQGGVQTPRNSEVLKKLDQIPSSVEYTYVTT